MARRFYQFELTNEQPIYYENIGHLIKISGLVLEGMNKCIIVLTPNTSFPTIPPLLTMRRPTWEEWDAIIKASDDPKYFEMDGHSIKAVHRKVRMQISGAVQQKVWVRDNFECQFCHRRMGDVQLTVDHWTPLELGGSNTPDNYITACRACNKKKGNIHPKLFCDQNGYRYRHLNMVATSPI